MKCNHLEYVKAGIINNKQYLKCKKCKKIFTLDKTDRRKKYNIEKIIKDVKKEIQKTKLKNESYEIVLRKLGKTTYKNKKLPSLPYIYKKLPKGLEKKPSPINFHFTENIPIPVTTIYGENIIIKKNVSYTLPVRKKSYERMKKLIRILEKRDISHNDFFRDKVLKNLKYKKRSKNKRIFIVGKNRWDYLNKNLDKRDWDMKDEAIQELENIIKENI